MVPAAEASKGGILLNGTDLIPLVFTAERLSGEPLNLHFAAMDIASLRLELDGTPAIGEIRVLGKP